MQKEKKIKTIHHKVVHKGQGFNPSNLVQVLGYAYDLGIMTHSTILVQKSLSDDLSSQDLQPSPHWLEHTLKQKTTCATVFLQAFNGSHCPPSPQWQGPISLSSSLTAPPPQALQGSSKLYTEDFHSSETDRWKVCEEWVGLERQTPGPLPTQGSTPTQIYSLSSAVSPIPIHTLHQVPTFYSKNKSWRQMTGMYLHSSCLNAILS